MMTRSAWLVFLSACALLPATVFAQFTISGVTDKTPYNDTVTLTITTQAGYNYNATLNWKPIATGVPVVVNKPDFYELRVDATNQTTSVVTSQYRRFIVNSSERVGTEMGLPPHIPFPVIQSSPSEFAGAHLRLTVPVSFPIGYSIPIVAWALDDQDHAVRANGLLKNSGATLFQVKRGVGSGFVLNTNSSGTLNLNLDLGGALATNVSVALETNVTWTLVSGTLSGATVWTNNSRIQITSGTIVPAGSSLTVGEGTIVRVNAGVNITNNGTITINGTLANPVVFMPTTSAPWGGFVQHASNASFTAIGTIFTGSGAQPCWFTGHECGSSISGITSHRGPQGLISLVGANCNLTMIDSAAMFLAGQFSHSVNGGANSYNIQLTRFLMQHTVSGGEFTKANFTVNDSAFIECPDDSVVFEDEDNDALYLVGGTHNFTNTLFGWTKDDGIDSGGTDDSTSGFGKLNYQSCWFEATFHEGNSLSGYKNTFSRDTVYYDCGQGIEDGYNAPTGRVDHCFFSACEAGIRHGDNYTGGNGNYDGRFTGTNCISIYNHRDLFGFNWYSSVGWTNSSDRFFVSNNFVSALDTNYPNNTLWNPAADGWRLGGFGGVGRVGVGFGARGTSLTQFPDGIPVGLSRFCTNEVRVDYSIDGTDGTHSSGTLIFPAGLTRNFVPTPTNANGVLRIALANPLNADVTGSSALLFQNLAPVTNAPSTVLSPLAASWKYLDDGSEQGTAWRAPGFNDSTWPVGAARLGFGPDPAPLGTTIRRYVTGTSGPQITNYYFRRSFTIANPTNFATIQFRYQRDDGCILYFNGNEMLRNNITNGVIVATNFAMITISPASETLRFWTNTFSATNLLVGINVIAVEVHQSTPTSSDIAWEMELRGVPAPPAPRVNLSRFGSDAVLYWNDATFALEEADFVTGPWRVASSNSPAGSTINSNRFFRLSK